MTRREFRRHFDTIAPGLGAWNSSLWTPETWDGARPSRYFVCIPPVVGHDENIFRKWCLQHCRGQVLCYSASDLEEWWGFTHRDDIVHFILRWA